MLEHTRLYVLVIIKYIRLVEIHSPGSPALLFSLRDQLTEREREKGGKESGVRCSRSDKFNEK